MKLFTRSKTKNIKLFKHQVLITTISVLVLVISMIGGSYAIFTASDKGEYNVITVGDLDVSYVDTGDGYGDTLSLTGAYPMSDSEGKKLTPYRFSVENSGNFAVDFKIKILYDVAIIDQDGCSSKLLDQKYIKYQLDNEEPALLSSKASSGYTIYSEQNLIGRSSQIHEVRIWITDSTSSGNSNEILGKHFHGKVVVETTQSGIDEKLTRTYAAGDSVILKDGSRWHVIKNSGSNKATIKLLSDYNLITQGENIGNYDTSCGKTINSTTACSPIVFDAANERTDSYCKNSVNGCNMFSKNNSVVLKDSTIKTWLETNYVPKIRTSLTNANGGTTENLTVSLPSMEEIATADGKTFNQAIFSQDISNSYLTTTNYWTKTASNTNSSYVWYIAGNSNKNAVEYANNNSQIGIRPVITTSKLNIETVNQ